MVPTKVQRKNHFPTNSPPKIFHRTNPGSLPAGKKPLCRGSFVHKLAQLRKDQKNQLFPKETRPNNLDICKGKISEKTDKQYFIEKQRAKVISFASVRKLSELESPLNKSYLNTLFCNHHIEKRYNKITSKYCKNRICSLCNRIRTAQLINAYLPEFEKWNQRAFITLTIPNVPENELKESIKKMDRVYKKIVDVLRKRGQPLKCTRKTETTYNPQTNLYHPHYHIISEGLRGDLIAYWKKYIPEIDYAGQDIKLAKEGSEKELFKYFSKVIFKGQFIPEAVDTILQAVKGTRVFRSYGFELSEAQKIAQEIEKIQARELTQQRYKEKIDGLYEWDNEAKTWINKEDDEILNPWKKDKKTEKLLSKINGAKIQNTIKKEPKKSNCTQQTLIFTGFS